MTETAQRIQTEEIASKPRIVTPSFEQPKTSLIANGLNSLLPVFGAIAAVLAVRLFLLFAVVGSFILAQEALTNNDQHSLWVLTAYCAFTILPLVWLDAYGRKK